jgi:hypothetical protein
MKSLKLVLIIMAFLGGSILAQAHHIKTTPRYGTVVVKLHRPKVVMHSGTSFYFAKGVWYKPHGKKFVIVKAPVGVRIKRLPRGYHTVWVKGRKYYKYNGVWYSKSKAYYSVVKIG